MRTCLATYPLLVVLLISTCSFVTGQDRTGLNRVASRATETQHTVLTEGNSTSLAFWNPFVELASSEGRNSDNFGVAAAVTENVAVVGASQDTNSTGAVYVYTRSAGSSNIATQTARLTASDGQPGDQFGSSVSISGNVIVVGAPGASGSQGKAYVFVKPASGWRDMSETAQLSASDGMSRDSFGAGIAIDGTTVIVGAPDRTVGSNASEGTVYVFIQPVGGWADMTQTAELTATNLPADGFLGFSVAVSGKTVVAGAYGAAAVCIFVEPASGWVNGTQTAELIDKLQTLKSQLGYSVAISGSTIVVGTPNGADAGQRAGLAEVYVKPGSSWKSTGTPNARLTATIRNIGDEFGYSVATTGNTVLAGAPKTPCLGTNCKQGFGPGYVFAYVQPASGWVDSTETAALNPSDAQSAGFFGASVAANGVAVLVGATGTDTAYVYEYFSNSTFTAFGYPEAGNTFGEGINNVGQIVGNYQNSDETSGAFLFENGAFTTILDPNALNTSAYKINNLGEVVGVLSFGSTTGGFSETGGIFTTINYPGASSTYAMGVNDTGDIVGDYPDTSGNLHGFLYSGGIYTTIDVPGAMSTVVEGINNSGQIAGWSCSSPCEGYNTVSFVYQNGTFTPYKYPQAPDGNTLVYGINNNGDLTGNWQAPTSQGNFVYFSSTKQWVPFYLEGSASFDLNDADVVVGTFANELGRFGFYGHLPGH